MRAFPSHSCLNSNKKLFLLRINYSSPSQLAVRFFTVKLMVKGWGNDLEEYAVLGKLADLDKRLEAIEQRLKRIENKLDELM